MKATIKLVSILFISFLLAELLLRIAGGLLVAPQQLTHGLPFFIDVHKGLFYFKNSNTRPLSTHYPGQTKRVPLATGGVTYARINNYGFRGKDFIKSKAKNSLRIATLGASSTFGFGVEDHQTYPYLLEQILKQSCTEYKHIEVLNFGAPYQDSAAIYRLYKQQILGFKPDIVSFYEGVNDTGNGPTSTLDLIWDKLSSSLLIFQYINVPIRDSLKSYKHEDVYWQQTHRKQAFVNNIKKIASLVKTHQALFIASTQQAQSYHTPNSQLAHTTYEQELENLMQKLQQEELSIWELRFIRHADFMSELRKLAKQENYILIDAIKTLNDKRNHLSTWVHLDAEGNRWLAEAFAEVIVKHKC